MIRLVIILVVSTFVAQAFGKCIPARRYVDFPESLEIGTYYRFHPSGDYVLASSAHHETEGEWDAQVAIIDLTGKNAENDNVILTPMVNETYPIEGPNGGWKAFCSPNHNDGMRYYFFDEIKDKKLESKPFTNDRNHNEWYQSAAELPGGDKNNYKFRTMLYGNEYRDYNANINSEGKVTNVTHTETKRACTNLRHNLSSPILSKDGTEVAHYDGTNQVIYKIKKNGDCELVDTIGRFSSKVNFGYPEAGKKGKLVYTSYGTAEVNGQAKNVEGTYIYDRDTKETKLISDPNDRSRSYSGITMDGRVMYVDQNKRRIAIVDPNQIDKNGQIIENPTKCIQEKSSGNAGQSSPAGGSTTGGSTEQ